MKNRDLMLEEGYDLLVKWCISNGVSTPTVRRWYTDPPFDACAYYRTDIIHIWPKECAAIGSSVRQWSFPGYVIDRTPYGVLQHELGHHADEAFDYRKGKFSSRWRRETDERPLTGYCGNDMEWFAEIFRLFVTNPDLLEKLRPRVFEKLIDQWPCRAEERSWEEVLQYAPDRWKRATQNKIREAQGRKQGVLFNVSV